jgi:hypothetical protein
VATMKHQYTEILLLTCIGLLPLAAIFQSATGGEWTGIALLAVALAGGIAVASGLLAGYRRSTQRAALSTWLVVPLVSAVILLSVAATDWPLRAGYTLSRDSLDAAAQRVGGGESPAMPLRCGTFSIQQAEVSRRGVVCLWTNLEPSGYTGFVQCPPDHVPSICGRSCSSTTAGSSFLKTESTLARARSPVRTGNA